jgi:hypothetical protein
MSRSQLKQQSHDLQHCPLTSTRTAGTTRVAARGRIAPQACAGSILIELEHLCACVTKRRTLCQSYQIAAAATVIAVLAHNPVDRALQRRARAGTPHTRHALHNTDTCARVRVFTLRQRHTTHYSPTPRMGDAAAAAAALTRATPNGMCDVEYDDDAPGTPSATLSVLALSRAMLCARRVTHTHARTHTITTLNTTHPGPPLLCSTSRYRCGVSGVEPLCHATSKSARNCHKRDHAHHSAHVPRRAEDERRHRRERRRAEH